MILTPGQSFACDAIRYLAALLVVFHHLPSFLKPEWYLSADRPLANMGEIGVTAFFMLSGLLISHTVTRKIGAGAYTFREYIIERSVRIYLVFLPALVLIVLVGGLSITTGIGVDEFEWRKFDLRHFITNLLMLSGVRQIAPHLDTFSYMEQSWTLNYEFFFYIMFGAFALPIRGRAGNALRVVTLVATALLAFQLARAALIVLGLTWALGVVASRLLIAGHEAHAGYGLAIASALIVAAIPSAFGHLVERLVLVLFVAALTFFLVSRSRKFRPSRRLMVLASTLAGFSYSLYLLHALILWLLFNAYQTPSDWARNTLGAPATACTAILIVNAAAWMFSLATERHNNAIRQRLILLRPRPAAVD